MRRKIICLALATVVLTGCNISSSQDIGGTRSYYSNPHVFSLDRKQKPEILAAYTKAFKCWESSPANDQGFVLSDITVVEQDRILDATFVYPDDPAKTAVKFTVDLGRHKGLLKTYYNVTAIGPERSSPFAMSVFDQHQHTHVTLCTVAKID